MRLENFDQCTAWMDSFTPPHSGAPGLLRNARLERMERLLAALGNPEESFRSVHIAGSKGKGSTARYISALLAAGGCRTGLYLSPHLFDYRERFTLDGAFFDDSLLVDTCRELADVVEDFRLPDSFGWTRPTTFELYTAFAYMLFRKAGCTHAVIETGLGGRLDATNTLSSWCSVITPVELEHTQVLGDTVAKIAAEKSRIIKRDQNVFTGLLRDEAERIMEEEAGRMGSRLYSLSRELVKLETRTTMEGEACSIAFRDGYRTDLVLSMRGEVQAQNAALALLCARRMGFYTPGSGEKALERASLPGRFEILHRGSCTIVLDVCHTRFSTIHTVSSFTALFPHRQTRACVFAAIEGKDVRHMLETILPAFALVVVTRPASWKKSDSAGIYELARTLCPPDTAVAYEEDSSRALDLASASAGAVLVAGSFYLAALYRRLEKC